MDRIIVIAVFVSIAFIGLWNLYRDIKSNQDKLTFANEFLSVFKGLYKNQEIDYEAYTWLIHRSLKLQNEMGELGIVYNYRRPHEGVVYRTYQVIINLIPEIKRELGEGRYMRDVRTINSHADLVTESLIRYIGSIDDRLGELHKEIRNPVIWLRKGAAWTLLLPLLVLHWLGITGTAFIERTSRNPLFKMITGLITLLGAISTIMTIIMGWNAFVNAVMSFATP